MADWYALSVLEEAVDDTKEILLPFNWKTWARLMVIVIFAGGGFNMPTGGGSFPDSGSDTGQYSGASGDMGSESYSVIENFSPQNPVTGLQTASPGPGVAAAIVGLIIGFALIFLYLNSVFSFIFYQSLLDREVRIRKNFRKHSYHGLQYLIFRIGIISAMVLLLVAAVVPAGLNPLVSLPLLMLWVLLLIPVAIFLGLTDNFILVRVIESNQGLIDAWKTFYSEIQGEFDQIAVYVIMRFVLKIAIAAMSFIWLVLSLLIVGIPFGIFVFLLYLASPVLAAIPVILGLIVWIVLMLAFQVPVQTFLTHYAILVYRELTE